MTRPEQATERIRELRRLVRRGWYVLVVSFVAAFMAAAAAMIYANRVAHESERKWCGIVVTLDDAYDVNPPETPAGRRIADDLARLRADFGCPV